MANIFLLLIKIGIISSVLILIVFIVDKLLSNRINLRIILFLWLLVLLRLIIPVFLSTTYSFYNLLPESITENIVYENVTDIAFKDTIILEPKAIDYSNSANNNIVKDTKAIEKTNLSVIDKIRGYLKNLSIFAYLFLFWLAGASFVAVKKIYTGLKFRKIIADFKQISMNEILSECRKKLQYSKKITVKISKYINSPMTFGVINPTIILPENLIGNIPPNKLRMIMIHEMAHIKRRDILVNNIWLFAKILHWYNPLIYIAYKQYLMNAELSCDKIVLDNISDDEKYDYSQSLLDVLKISRSASTVKTLAGLAFCEDNTKIRKRVNKMLNSKKQIKAAGILTVLLAFMLFFCCFTTACLPSAKGDIYISENDSEKLSESLIFEGTEYYILDTYITDENARTIISGSSDEKEAVHIAKAAIGEKYEISSQNLVLQEIENIGSDESKFRVIIDDINKDSTYYVDVNVATGKIESVTQEPKVEVKTVLYVSEINKDTEYELQVYNEQEYYLLDSYIDSAMAAHVFMKSDYLIDKQAVEIAKDAVVNLNNIEYSDLMLHNFDSISADHTQF